MSNNAVPKMQWLERDPVEAFADIRENSILSFFPSDFLDILSTFGETRMYGQGEDVLRQGDMNSEFFFLLSGSVEIVIDGVSEYILKEVGEVFGEMSLIVEAPCSATVRAVEDSCVLVFAHEEIQNIVEDNKEEFGYVLFQVFSKVLTKRLTDANKSLKLVETKSREMSRLSREIELIAHERFQELWGKGNITYDHLERIYKNEICKLVDDLESEAPPDIEEIKNRLAHSKEGFRPIFDMYSRERSLQLKRVLLAEPDVKNQRFTKTALVGAGVTLRIADNREEAVHLLNSEPFDIVLTSPSMLEVAETAHSLNPNTKLLLLKNDESVDLSDCFEAHPYLTNVVSLHDTARVFTLKNIFTTVCKLASGDLFGMEKYLNWGADVQEMVVEGSEQRKDVLDAMESYFSKAGLRDSIVDRCLSVAEEMLMNVVYDAPVDDKGVARYNHLNRSNAVKLEPYEKGKFYYACDGVMAAVAVQDPFGALDRQTVLKHLKAAQSGHQLRRENKAGGGMGIHVIVEMSDFVIFNVREGVKTEVIALFNIDKKAEEHFQGPFFHLFYEN